MSAVGCMYYYMPDNLSLYLAFWRFIPTSEEQLNKDYVTPKVTKYQRCNFIIQIHKFTLKIDTISINLLFECVKIVEFLKFQFPRVSCHVSRDTFSKSRCMFLKSRRETTVFDQFCFRKGLKTCSRFQSLSETEMIKNCRLSSWFKKHTSWFRKKEICVSKSIELAL